VAEVLLFLFLYECPLAGVGRSNKRGLWTLRVSSVPVSSRFHPNLLIAFKLMDLKAL
jgi:hypothetical protein